MTDPEHVPTMTVGDIMTKDVLAIDVNDGLDVIVGLFEKYDYDGMPVVDASGKMLGLINSYDLVMHSTDLHLPTLLKLMDAIMRDKGDRQGVDDHFTRLRQVRAASIMNTHVMTLKPEDSIAEAAKVFSQFSRVNPICVVDGAGKLVGVVSRFDLIRFFSKAYFNQAMQGVTENRDPFRAFATRSEREVETLVEEVQSDFLIVNKRRPLLWKYVSIGTFAAGLLAATALIIRIVSKGG